MTRTQRPKVRPASESISAVGFQAFAKVGWPIPTCDDCGVQLNVAHVGDDRDGFLAEDRVLAGSQPKRGHVRLCRTDAFDPTRQAERKRRLRRVPAGNFMESLA